MPDLQATGQQLPFQLDHRWTVFLDRDGVLNRRVDGDYVRSTRQLEVLPGVAEAVRDLSERVGRVVVVTNQRGIGRGLMTWADVESVHAELNRQVGHAGGEIDAFYICPHTVEDKCRCRK